MGPMLKGAAGPFVSRAWAGETVVCIASGPSVTAAGLELLRAARERDEIRVIAINDMYLVAPFADVHYFADDKWRRQHEAGVAKRWPWVSFTAAEVKQAWRAFGGQQVTISHWSARDEDGVFILGCGRQDGLSGSPDTLNTGSNSGYQALNLAVLAGGNPIVLVGYDFRYAGGRSHSHDGHADKHPEANYYAFAERFQTMKGPLKERGVEVVNTSLGSVLKVFPIKSLAEVLGACARAS